MAVLAAVLAAPISSASAADVAAQVNASVGASSSFVGGGHTCVVTTTGGIRCWGDNSTGQLGDGTFDQRTSPVTVSGVSNAVQVASGGDHSCARLANGDVYCWGDNTFGQIGSDPDSVANSATAIKVVGVSGATAITAGSQHTCALLPNKTVSCWGNGLWGVLGVDDANGNSSFTPLAVTGLTNVTQIAAGASHTCALSESGVVSCWGSNDSGQLGIGALEWMPLPTAIAGLTGVAQLAAGATNTCAAMTDRSVKCWGDNTFGQIGDATDTNRLTPTAVSGLADATSVTVGDSFACARLSGGSVKCWGVTDPGIQWCEVLSGTLKNCFSIVEYGDRSLDPTIDLAVNPAAVSYTPKAITGIADAAQLSAGDRHLCILRVNSSVACLGLNAYGQLGDKTTTATSAPVAVAGLGATLPPPTVTGGVPAAFTKLTSATISFTGEAKATFTCSLDGGKPATCTSPRRLTLLKDGTHSLSIVQKNQSGVSSTPTVVTWTVDTKAPAAPTLRGAPTPFTTLTGASIAITGETNAVLSCSIDGGPFNPCANPTTLNSLPDGAHSLTARQTDRAGNTSPNATANWTVDTIAPAAPTITSSPASPLRSQKATIAFTGEASATFVCSLNGANFTACTSPTDLDKLNNGPQSLAIRQTDRAGNTSQPATATWTVDASAPQPPTVTGGAPAAFTKLTSATISFTGEAKATFTCSLDGGKPASCTSPRRLTLLKDGTHSLSIVQKNESGISSTPTVITWKVDTKAPAAPTLRGAPTPFTTLTGASIAITGETNAVLSCSIDGGPFNPCVNPTTLNSLPDGAHSLTVRQTDQAGNTSPNATANWTVDTIAPTLTRKIAGYISRRGTSTSIALRPAKDASGIAFVEYSTATVSPAPTVEPITANVVKYGSPTVIRKSVAVKWLRIRDGAGNNSQWYKAT